jgi:hypothetical protein
MRPGRRSVDISVPPPQHRATGRETVEPTYPDPDVVHLWVVQESHPRRRLPGVLDVVFACAAALSLR